MTSDPLHRRSKSFEHFRIGPDEVSFFARLTAERRLATAPATALPTGVSPLKKSPSTGGAPARVFSRRRWSRSISLACEKSSTTLVETPLHVPKSPEPAPELSPPPVVVDATPPEKVLPLLPGRGREVLVLPKEVLPLLPVLVEEGTIVLVEEVLPLLPVLLHTDVLPTLPTLSLERGRSPPPNSVRSTSGNTEGRFRVG